MGNYDLSRVLLQHFVDSDQAKVDKLKREIKSLADLLIKKNLELEDYQYKLKIAKEHRRLIEDYA